MLRIARNPEMKGLATLIPNIVYSTTSGTDISLDLIVPWYGYKRKKELRYPTVVFIQGSAWTFPITGTKIPQLSRLAQKGFVVATIRHRNINDGYCAPAFLEDAKCAIRFLRANSEKYNIDPDHIYTWGTSSGGNTALLLGLTGDDPRFKTNEYNEYSDCVSGVVDCFGPTDLYDLLKFNYQDFEHPEAQAFLKAFCGKQDQDEILTLLSPINHVKPNKDYVPFMIIHGDNDTLVPFSESENMVKKLEEVGAKVDFICVEGAEHEGTFWSLALHDIIDNFFIKLAYKENN